MTCHLNLDFHTPTTTHPDGEPEDVVVGYVGFYETLEELEANIDADIYSFEQEVGCSMEDGGGWVEVVFEGEDDDEDD